MGNERGPTAIKALVTVLAFVGATALSIWAQNLGLSNTQWVAIWIVSYALAAVLMAWLFWRHRFWAAWRAFKNPEQVLGSDQPFDPASLLIEAWSIDLLGLAGTDPTVTLGFRIQNLSGRNIRIEGVKGDVGCGFSSGLVAAKLLNDVNLYPHSDSQLASVSQVFSQAVANKIITALALPGSSIGFQFGSVKLLGRADGQEITRSLSNVLCWVKGPFTFDAHNQAMLARIQPGGFVSQTQYDTLVNPQPQK